MCYCPTCSVTVGHNFVTEVIFEVIDRELNLTASHGQGAEKDREGSARQILQACKVRQSFFVSIAAIPIFHPGNKATEPVRRLS